MGNHAYLWLLVYLARSAKFRRDAQIRAEWQRRIREEHPKRQIGQKLVPALPHNVLVFPREHETVD